MSTLSKPTKRLLGVGATALVAVALLFWPVEALTVRPARAAGLYWAVPAGPGTVFSLTWTHSVTRRPVAETYVIEPDRRLALTSMVFDTFGPNLPAGPEAGTVWRIEKDRYVVTGYDTKLERLVLGVGPLGHELRVGRRSFNMYEGIGPERSIRIQLERTPLILIVLTEVWQWRTASSQS